MVRKLLAVAATTAGLLSAAQSGAATTVNVVGEFTNYRFIGVAFNPAVENPLDPSTWAVGPITFSLAGTITVDGGVVTGATLSAGTIEILYTSTGGVNPTLGTFEGFVYEYAGGTVLQQQGFGVGGTGVTGTCEMQPGATQVNVGCTNALAALQNGTDTRINNWNGIPENYVISDIFGGSGLINLPTIAGDGIVWNIGGLEVGNSISAELLRSEPGGANGPFFNAAFAGTLDLTVVPVPAAVWLFASALGLIGFIRRRAVA